MDTIQLLYVENVINRKKRRPRQELRFFMRLKNISFDKQVDVLWKAENGHWSCLHAEYFDRGDAETEVWQAKAIFSLTAEEPLPGNIQFALRYRVVGKEFWDNRQGQNYSIQADSGILLGQGIKIQNIGFEPRLKKGQKTVPVNVAIDHTVDVEKVTIHWTLDNWRHTHETVCQSRNDYWFVQAGSNARNPNQYGTRLWSCRLRTGQAFRLQYSICCESHGRKIWDNNAGRNYVASHKALTVMILNLHCYQEARQDEKFSVIARVIDEQNVDIVCFQEVAEAWNEGEGDWQSNSANVINRRLKSPFFLYFECSHRGFDRYREGVAILSRYSLLKQEARYVSDDDDIYSIHSRKVVMAQIRVPYMGLINVFSAHLSWWEDGFQQQFRRLCDWAGALSSKRVKGTLLCGDFNITAGSEGYRLVVDGHQYEDQFLAANQQGLFERIFRVNDAHWSECLSDDYRIDYIFLNRDSGLRVVSARTVFTGQDYEKVSDHCGYIMTFEPK